MRSGAELSLFLRVFLPSFISIRKRTVDTDVVSDVTCTRKSGITRVVIRFYDVTLSTE